MFLSEKTLKNRQTRHFTFVRRCKWQHTACSYIFISKSLVSEETYLISEYVKIENQLFKKHPFF